MLARNAARYTIDLFQTRWPGLENPQGWQVYIGADLANFEAKYDMYQKIAKHLGDQGVKANLVNVENLNAPFYRLEH